MQDVVTEDEASGASASNPLAEDVDMGQIPEPQVQTSIPEFVNPPQPHGQMSDFSNWVGMISQAVMSLATGPPEVRSQKWLWRELGD